MLLWILLVIDTPSPRGDTTNLLSSLRLDYVILNNYAETNEASSCRGLDTRKVVVAHVRDKLALPKCSPFSALKGSLIFHSLGGDDHHRAEG